MNKAGTRWILLLLVLAVGLQAEAIRRSEPEITLIAVPRDPVSIRIAMEMQQRYPVLLVTYEQARGRVRIHAWNGQSWVGVSEQDYQHGRFFQRAPKQMILVDSDETPMPGVLIPEGGWCRSIYRLASTDPRVMLHLLGRHFDIPYRVWRDLSWRYRYTLEEINPGLINVPWWHYRARDVYQARVQRNLAADLEKWFYLDLRIEEPRDPEEVMEEAPDSPEIPLIADEEPMEDPPATDGEEAEEELESNGEPVAEEEAGYVTDPFSDGDVEPAKVIEM